MKRSLLGAVLFVLAAIWAAGCGGGGGGGGNNGGNNGGATVTSVTLAASGPTTLLIGQTVQLTPTARNANGAAVTVPSANFTFTSSSAPNASVSSTGLVTAISSSVPSQVITITVKESSSGKTASQGVTISTGQGGVSARTVIYTSDRDGVVPAGQPKTTNIYKEDLDTGVVTQLTHNVGNVSSINASPCPDGTKIAFESNQSGNFEIYMMNADGSGVVPATANGATNEMPRFSPDSTKIIFASSKDKSGVGATRDSNGRDLYTVPLPVAGAVPTATRLTNTGDGVFNVDPQYSPDNTKIAFAVIPAGASTEDIFVMNADGTGAQQRTNKGAITRWPVFSPDGAKIVFITNAGSVASQSSIGIMNSDGTGQATLFSNGNLLLEPAFLPTSTIVYVSNNVLHLLNLDGTVADASALGVQLMNSHTGTSIESFPHVRLSP
jgi:hypothetical protein